MKFSKNFNNKLDCNYFTTFRVHEKWFIGENVILLLNNKFKIGHIIDVKKVHISAITDWHCYLDVGLCKIDTLLLLQKYYSIDVKFDYSYLFYYIMHSSGEWLTMDNEQPFIDLL